MMRARSQTYTEQTLPPVRRVPLDKWEHVKHRQWEIHIPEEFLGFRAGLEIVEDWCMGPAAVKVGGLMGGWLLYAERVGPYVVAAWPGLATLLSRGIVRRCAQIKDHAPQFKNSNAWFVYSRLSAVRTAELAVLTLRERQRRPGPRPTHEAWLRRQIEGLREPA
jgi:hypothetical protein